VTLGFGLMQLILQMLENLPEGERHER